MSFFDFSLELSTNLSRLIEMSCGIIACCMPTIHLFWSRHTYLLKFGSKVRSSVRSILRITRSSYSSQEASEKHGEVNLRVSPLTGSDQMMSKDEIFVIQGHSVNDFDRGGNHSVDSQKSLGGWGPLKHNRGN